MESLPAEILSLAFLKLDHHDWIQCINVCRAWRTSLPSIVASVWQHLEVDEDNLHYLKIIHRFPSVRSFELHIAPPLDFVPAGQIKALDYLSHPFHNAADVVNACAGHTEHIESLSLRHSYNSIHDFTRIFNDFPKLTHFRLRLYNLEPASSQMTIGEPPAIYTDTSLVALELYTQTLFSVEPILMRCPHLRLLSVDPSCFEVFPPIEVFLYYCPQLVYLHISYVDDEKEPIPDWSLLEQDKTSGAASEGCQLRYIYLHDHEHQQATVAPVARFLEELHLIGLVNMRPFGSNRIKTFTCGRFKNERDLIYFLKHSPNLKTFIVSDDNIDAKALIEGLHSLDHLRAFRLPSAIILNDAIRILRPFEKTLTKLILSYGVGIRSKADIETLLAQVTSLKELVIRFCGYEGGHASLDVLTKCAASLEHVQLECFTSFTYDNLVYLEDMAGLHFAQCSIGSYESLMAMITQASRLRKVMITGSLKDIYAIPDDFIAVCKARHVELKTVVKDVSSHHLF